MPVRWSKAILYGQRAGRESKVGGKRCIPNPKSPRVFGHALRRAKAPLRAGLKARVSTNDDETLPMQGRQLSGNR